MRAACIDIGSNTTRLLVAEGAPGALVEVHQERAFTRIGRELRGAGVIGDAKIDEVVDVVAGQLATARQRGAQDVHAVATAAIRDAVNGGRLAEAIAHRTGLRVRILTAEEEARLAFRGAAAMLAGHSSHQLGVIDVGGGSSEIVVGTAPDRVEWWTSLSLGSGSVADRHLASDPPAPEELAAARAEVDLALAQLDPPHPAAAVAVGGSATSLCRLAGTVLDAPALERALAVMAGLPAQEVAVRFGIDPVRARLLPAGLLILGAAAQKLGTTLTVGQGGIREGVLLEAQGP